KLQEQERSLTAANANLEKEIKIRTASEEKIQNLNRQLLKNINHLESVNAELDRFAFMASHDLQEPLRKIRLFANKFIIKNKSNVNEEDLQDIERIQKSAERMQLLIRDILTMAKISVDTSEFVPTEMNLLVKETLAEFEEEIILKRAKVNVNELPSLLVHPRLMKLLFHNLISNALKYRREEARPVINIYCESPSYRGKIPENQHCRIIVKDNGLGFDQRFSKDIFGMFTRLNYEGQSDGTGLGLALCKRIAEYHKGSIAAEGKINEGAIFTLSLPANGVAKKMGKEH
ncbi:MAG TPA: ATP-binding protein, partial [Cyclobacteriaceae bacterium]|nr:ATP-binding protein [Cyclobacteriaceae bacterium]